MKKNILIYLLPLVILVLITGSAYSQTARLHVIHNSTDPAADSVAVYLNGIILL